MFYKKKDSAGLAVMLTFTNGTIHRKVVTGLDKYTEYEFQVLAYTSVGDGLNSSVVVERTKEDGKSLVTHVPCICLLKCDVILYL